MRIDFSKGKKVKKIRRCTYKTETRGPLLDCGKVADFIEGKIKGLCSDHAVVFFEEEIGVKIIEVENTSENRKILNAKK